MSHVRKLELYGKIRGRQETISSTYSWPNGARIDDVNDLIEEFHGSFDSVSAVIKYKNID